MIKDIKNVGFINIFDRWEDLSNSDALLQLNNTNDARFKKNNLNIREQTMFYSTLLKSKNDINDWCEALTNLNFIYLKLIHEGVEELISDYNVALQIDTNTTQKTKLKYIRDALEVAGHILRRLPSQLPEQLLYLLTKDQLSRKLLINFIFKLNKSKNSPFFFPHYTEVSTVRDFKIRTISDHIGMINGLAVTPDDKYVISADNNALKVWNIKRGEFQSDSIINQEIERSDLTGISFSTSGKYLLATFRNGSLIIWTTNVINKSFQLIEKFRLQLNSEKALLSVKPISDFLFATASTSGTIHIWDAKAGVLHKKIDTSLDAIHDIAVFSDQKRIVAGGGATFSGNEMRCLILKDWLREKILFKSKPHEWPIDYIVLSKNEDEIISTANESLYVWNIKTNKLKSRVKFEFKIHALNIHPSGKYLVVGVHEKIKVLLYEDLKELITISGHHGLISSLEFDSQGKFLFSCSWDQTISCWLFDKLSNNDKPLGHTESVNTLAISQNEQILISSSNDNRILVWDLSSRQILKELNSHENWVRAVAINSEHNLFCAASWDGKISLWDLKSYALIKKFNCQDIRLESIAISMDNLFIAVGSNDGELIVFNNLENSKKSYKYIEGAINEIKFTQDGSKLILISSAGQLLILSTLNWKIINKFQHNVTLEDYDSNYSNEEIATLKRTFTGIASFDIVNENTFIIATNDGFLSTLTIQNGSFKKSEIASISCCITSLKYLKRRNAILTCSGTPHYASDNTIRLWDLKSKHIITQFTMDTPLSTCCYTELKNRAIIGDSSGSIHFFELKNL